MSFLNQTLQSVYAQSHQNWECLIIDDGSTDHTATIANAWVAKDRRYHYYYKNNGGLSSARNYGLERANGTYIQLLDSDDLIEPTKFERQLLVLKEADISICDYFPFNHETGAYVADRYLSPLLSQEKAKMEVISEWEYRKSIPCHTVLFRRELIDRHKLIFDEHLENHEDWVFWVQLFYFSRSIVFNDEKLARYRMHEGSMTVDYFKMKRGFLKATEILEDFFKSKNESMYVKEVRKKRKEIRNKGKEPIYIKIPKRVYRKLLSKYKNVRKN